MHPDITQVMARHVGRPLLITPQHAEHYVSKLRAMDPNFSARPSRWRAMVRKLSVGQPVAMDDDEPARQAPIHELGAYSPLYAGEVDDIGFCWSLKDGIALMEVNTPLLDRGEAFCGMCWHGYDTLLTAMREASADERVKAIFLRADSPGGVVAGGLGALAAWMRANRAAAGGKPIHVYADMSCSAMFWITAQADRIIASDVGMLGSIGAVIVHESLAGWLEKTGIEITPIQFGRLKTEGAWWQKLSAETQANLQADIDQCGRNFTADVAAGRPALTIEKQLATEAQVYLGRHDDPARSAFALGLCDEIMGEEAAFAALAASVSGASPVTQPSIAAATAAVSAQEQLMADAAQLKKDLKAARAAKDDTKINAILAQMKAEGVEDDESEDDPNKNKDVETGRDEDEKDEGETEAQKIAKSPEAKSNPSLATVAIAQGMTLGQFKAVAASAPAGGRLAAHLNGSARLGADGGTGNDTPGARLQARAQKRADKFSNKGGK